MEETKKKKREIAWRVVGERDEEETKTNEREELQDLHKRRRKEELLEDLQKEGVREWRDEEQTQRTWRDIVKLWILTTLLHFKDNRIKMIVEDIFVPSLHKQVGCREMNFQCHAFAARPR